MSTPHLGGKVALVTGSSRGIGAAIARRLVNDGAKVIVNYVNNDKKAAAVVDELNAIRSNSAVSIRADISSIAAVEELSAQALKAFGKIDILVLNTGIAGSNTLADVDEKTYNTVFDTNVKGPLFLTKALAPHLPEDGRIIFFSTTLASISAVRLDALVYVAAKGAVEQITRALSKDLGPRGITVNCIAPGPIDTGMFREGKTDSAINFLENLHPLKRLGRPDEVSGLVSMLVGPDGSWINGQTIRVNGGLAV